MNGLIVFNSNPCNVGDYIQSLASSLFFDRIDRYIEREDISNISAKESIHTIMNAWWMWSKQWPPSSVVNPLYISMHISPAASKWMLNEEGVAYFSKHNPVGCRDLNTLKMFQKKGIESYFSGCMTLTIGKQGKYITDKKSNEVIICDPYYNINIKSLFGKGNCNLISLIITLIKERHFFKKIYSSFGYKHKMYNVNSKFLKKLGHYFQLAYFYNSYSKLFSPDLIKGANYTSQWIENHNYTHEKLINKASQLVKRYAKAKMIITSRIHCALPSIGCETPVLFVTSSNLKSLTESPVGGRLDGLSNFFNLIEYNDRNELNISDSVNFDKPDIIDSNFSFQNKKEYISYRDDLIERCRTFVEQCIKTDTK